jgi:hypothetical protein
MRAEDIAACVVIVGVFGVFAYIIVREATRPSTVIVEPSEKGGWVIVEKRAG